MLKSKPRRRAPAFTLVELVMVMALLAFITAMAAPSLGRSMRERHLADETKRFLALTEYARSEALSQGLPMSLWLNPDTGQFGVETKAGFTGNSQRERQFSLDPDVHFQLAAPKTGVLQAIEFAPDGLPDPASIASLQLVDRFAASFTVALTADRAGYEIVED